MSKTPNIHGGGARTNANGLLFEQTTSLNEALENRGYQVIDCSIYRKDSFMLQQPIGMSVAKGSTELLDAINAVLDGMTADDFNTLMDQAIAVQPEV